MAHEIIPSLGRVAATETFCNQLGRSCGRQSSLRAGSASFGQDLGDEEALGFLAGFQQSRALGASVFVRAGPLPLFS